MRIKSLSFIFLVFIPFILKAKDVKISVTPSTAKIYIDGNYVGDGIVTATVKKKMNSL